MSRMFSNLFRINLAEYYLIDDIGLNKRITPRPKILFDSDSLVIVSNLDQKIYNFTGINASEKKQTAAAKLEVEPIILEAKEGYIFIKDDPSINIPISSR